MSRRSPYNIYRHKIGSVYYDFERIPGSDQFSRRHPEYTYRLYLSHKCADGENPYGEVVNRFKDNFCPRCGEELNNLVDKIRFAIKLKEFKNELY